MEEREMPNIFPYRKNYLFRENNDYTKWLVGCKICMTTYSFYLTLIPLTNN